MANECAYTILLSHNWALMLCKNSTARFRRMCGGGARAGVSGRNAKNVKNVRSWPLRALSPHTKAAGESWRRKRPTDGAPCPVIHSVISRSARGEAWGGGGADVTVRCQVKIGQPCVVLFPICLLRKLLFPADQLIGIKFGSRSRRTVMFRLLNMI